MEESENTVYFECCHNCDTHAWCTRHDEAKYHSVFVSIKKAIRDALPELDVALNQVPLSYTPLKKENNDNKFYHAASKKCVYFPGLGSFEIHFNNILIFSKYESERWPQPQEIVRLLSQVQEEKKNEGNLKKFSMFELGQDNLHRMVEDQEQNIERRIKERLAEGVVEISSLAEYQRYRSGSTSKKRHFGSTAYNRLFKHVQKELEEKDVRNMEELVVDPNIEFQDIEEEKTTPPQRQSPRTQKKNRLVFKSHVNGTHNSGFTEKILGREDNLTYILNERETFYNRKSSQKPNISLTDHYWMYRSKSKQRNNPHHDGENRNLQKIHNLKKDIKRLTNMNSQKLSEIAQLNGQMFPQPHKGPLQSSYSEMLMKMPEFIKKKGMREEYGEKEMILRLDNIEEENPIPGDDKENPAGQLKKTPYKIMNEWDKELEMLETRFQKFEQKVEFMKQKKKEFEDGSNLDRNLIEMLKEKGKKAEKNEKEYLVFLKNQDSHEEIKARKVEDYLNIGPDERSSKLKRIYGKWRSKEGNTNKKSEHKVGGKHHTNGSINHSLTASEGEDEERDIYRFQPCLTGQNKIRGHLLDHGRNVERREYQCITASENDNADFESDSRDRRFPANHDHHPGTTENTRTPKLDALRSQKKEQDQSLTAKKQQQMKHSNDLSKPLHRVSNNVNLRSRHGSMQKMQPRSSIFERQAMNSHNLPPREDKERSDQEDNSSARQFRGPNHIPGQYYPAHQADSVHKSNSSYGERVAGMSGGERVTGMSGGERVTGMSGGERVTGMSGGESKRKESSMSRDHSNTLKGGNKYHNKVAEQRASGEDLVNQEQESNHSEDGYRREADESFETQDRQNIGHSQKQIKNNFVGDKSKLGQSKGMQRKIVRKENATRSNKVSDPALKAKAVQQPTSSKKDNTSRENSSTRLHKENEKKVDASLSSRLSNRTGSELRETHKEGPSQPKEKPIHPKSHLKAELSKDPVSQPIHHNKNTTDKPPNKSHERHPSESKMSAQTPKTVKRGDTQPTIINTRTQENKKSKSDSNFYKLKASKARKEDYSEVKQESQNLSSGQEGDLERGDLERGEHHPNTQGEQTNAQASSDLQQSPKKKAQKPTNSTNPVKQQSHHEVASKNSKTAKPDAKSSAHSPPTKTSDKSPQVTHNHPSNPKNTHTENSIQKQSTHSPSRIADSKEKQSKPEPRNKQDQHTSNVKASHKSKDQAVKQKEKEKEKGDKAQQPAIQKKAGSKTQPKVTEKEQIKEQFKQQLNEQHSDQEGQLSDQLVEEASSHAQEESKDEVDEDNQAPQQLASIEETSSKEQPISGEQPKINTVQQDHAGEDVPVPNTVLHAQTVAKDVIEETQQLHVSEGQGIQQKSEELASQADKSKIEVVAEDKQPQTDGVAVDDQKGHTSNGDDPQGKSDHTDDTHNLQDNREMEKPQAGTHSQDIAIKEAQKQEPAVADIQTEDNVETEDNHLIVTPKNEVEVAETKAVEHKIVDTPKGEPEVSLSTPEDTHAKSSSGDQNRNELHIPLPDIEDHILAHSKDAEQVLQQPQDQIFDTHIEEVQPHKQPREEIEFEGEVPKQQEKPEGDDQRHQQEEEGNENENENVECEQFEEESNSGDQAAMPTSKGKCEVTKKSESKPEEKQSSDEEEPLQSQEENEAVLNQKSDAVPLEEIKESKVEETQQQLFDVEQHQQPTVDISATPQSQAIPDSPPVAQQDIQTSQGESSITQPVVQQLQQHSQQEKAETRVGQQKPLEKEIIDNTETHQQPHSYIPPHQLPTPSQQTASPSAVKEEVTQSPSTLNQIPTGSTQQPIPLTKTLDEPLKSDPFQSSLGEPNVQEAAENLQLYKGVTNEQLERNGVLMVGGETKEKTAARPASDNREFRDFGIQNSGVANAYVQTRNPFNLNEHPVEHLSGLGNSHEHQGVPAPSNSPVLQPSSPATVIATPDVIQPPVHQEIFEWKVDMKRANIINNIYSPTGETLTRYPFYLQKHLKLNNFQDSEFPFTKAIKDTTDMGWESLRKISKNAQLFSQDKSCDLSCVTISDKRSSFLGSVIKILALRNPHLITRLFESFSTSNNGLYGLWLCHNSAWTSVIVDDSVPVIKGSLVPAFINTKNQIWPLILEKAVAKVCGGYHHYEQLAIPELFRLLTGSNFVSFRIKEDPSMNIKAIKYTAENENKNFILHCEKHKKDLPNNSMVKLPEILTIQSTQSLVENKDLIQLKIDKGDPFWMKFEVFCLTFKCINILHLRQNYLFTHIPVQLYPSSYSIIEMNVEAQTSAEVSLCHLGDQDELPKMTRLILYREEDKNILKLIGQAKERSKRLVFFDCQLRKGKYYLFLEGQKNYSNAHLMYSGQEKAHLKRVENIENHTMKNEHNQYIPICRENRTREKEREAPKYLNNIFQLGQQARTGSKKEESQSQLEKIKSQFLDYLASEK